jgi:hypothetical protein
MFEAVSLETVHQGSYWPLRGAARPWGELAFPWGRCGGRASPIHWRLSGGSMSALLGAQFIPNEIQPDPVLENCRALIKQIMPRCVRKSLLSMSHRRQSFFFILSVPLLLSKHPCHARESEPPIIIDGAASANPSPWEQVYSRPTVGLSVRGHRQRAQGRRKRLPATTCQRSGRASFYGARSQLGREAATPIRAPSMPAFSVASRSSNLECPPTSPSP